MYFKSLGVASGNPDVPFAARILRCTRNREEVQHEWPAPTLEAAQQQADDWLVEWGVRLGLQQGGPRATAEARRRRISGIAGMPKLPPLALETMKAEVVATEEAWELEEASEPPEAKVALKRDYATKAEIVRAIAAARAGGLRVAEIHIKRDGTIAILSEEACRLRERTSAYDKWKQDEARRE